MGEIIILAISIPLVILWVLSLRKPTLNDQQLEESR